MNKKKILKLAIILVILLIIFGFFINNREKDPYEFKGNTLYYSQYRETPDYNIEFIGLNNTIEIYKINFESKNFLEYPTSIYGLLFIPKGKEKVPGIVLLPGGGGTKEGEAKLALKLANLGYGVLTIDQRGIGETGGYYLNPERDYQIFLQGKEPIQHLSVYDILRTYDVLKQIEKIDKDNIGLVGESMGARYAIIAAAIDKNLKGVIAISTSGFHISPNPLNPYNDYLVSIDPDHYISKISPNFVMMLHGTNDSVVRLEDAQITFDKAKEPKRFFIAEGCKHGYCEKMDEGIKKGLEIMFKNT